MNRETQTIYQHLVDEPEELARAKRLVAEAGDTHLAAIHLESYFGVDNIRASGLIGDLVIAAMERVDWSEIVGAVSEDQ